MSLFERPASVIAWSNGPLAGLDEIRGELLELGPRQLHVEVLRTLGGRGDERQVDRRLLNRGKLDLRLLGSLLQTLQRHLVVRQVDAFGVLEGLHQPVDDALVPVVTTEVGVARGRLHLEHAVTDLEHRDVERSTTEVEHEDRLLRASPCRGRMRAPPPSAR